jgi:PAS domain S-box-containing protein
MHYIKRISIRRDLGLQLLALYLLFVGPVVLTALTFDRIASQRLVMDIKAGDLALARAIAQETNTTMDHALQSVEILAQYPAVINVDNAAMEELFSTFMSARPEVNLVYRLDSDGIMKFHQPTGPGSTVGTDFSFRDYYQKALTTRDALISLGRISPTTGQPVATAVMPLWNDTGDFLGLVATNIKLESLSTTLTSIASEYLSDENFNVTIIDTAGRVIAHPNPTSETLLVDMSVELPEIYQSIVEGNSNNLIAPDRNGQETLYSYVPVPKAGWGVIVSRPTSVAFATPRAFHRGVLLLVGVFLGIGLIFWIALSRQVIRPLERLAALSRVIGRQQDITPEQRDALQDMADRPDQMGHLIRSLTRMEDAIEARLNELSTLLQTSAAVVSTLDSKTVLERILEQVERLLEVKKCAIVALDEERGIFRAQASLGLSRRYSEQISIDPREPQSVSLRAIRTGQPIQISDTEEDPTFRLSRPRSRIEGYRSVLAVPLNTQHAPPSALLVYRPEPHVFSEREINLLTNFANHAAMAIENAALYARSDMQLQEQTRRLEALIQSLQDGLILENLEGRVLYANRRISELLELASEEIRGVAVEKLIERLLSRSSETDVSKREKIHQAVLEALNSRGDRRVELSVRDARRTRYLRLQMFDVTDSQGMPIGRGQILRDITTRHEVDRMKSSLISTVSHELRTPLAAIKGYATTLLAEDVNWDPRTQREFLTIISNETDRLSDLVNDLLDMSRIEAGNLIVSRVECDLKELIDRAAERSHPRPGNRLKVELPQGLPTFSADPKRIEAVLRNLIENAAKYAGESSPILVSASRNGNNLIVRVEDEGPGIPSDESDRIFESFYRVENGLNRSAPGAGIGLAICQGFVHAHGGEIWLEPRPRGTSVAFSLPLVESTSEMAVPLID